MDSLRIVQQPGYNHRRWGFLILFGLVALAVIAVKAFREGWFSPHQPLDLGNEPALLFFNRHRGCRCALVVYQAADHQINAWSEEKRHGIPIIRIDLDVRSDLGDYYNVVRAPELMLVDAKGQLIHQQGKLVSDTQPFDLDRFEEVIREYLGGKFTTPAE